MDCSKECHGHGSVVAKECACHTDWTGDLCEKHANPCKTRAQGGHTDGGVQDAVTGEWRCICASGFSGDACTLECSGHGKAMRGKAANAACICDKGFSNPEEADQPSLCQINTAKGEKSVGEKLVGDPEKSVKKVY